MSTSPTDLERYVLSQVHPGLRPGEVVRSIAFLTPDLSGTGLAGVAKAATAVAGLAALTDERLILIQTRPGAFGPLLENRGVSVFEKSQLKGVFVGSHVLFERADGEVFGYLNNQTRKHSSTQAEFFRQLPLVFGVSEAASKLDASNTKWGRVGLVVGILLAGWYLWERFH